MSKVKAVIEASDGGPAFPRERVFIIDGMTLRDYFAAHAPKNPQPWFEPQMESELPAITFDHDHETCDRPWTCLPGNQATREAWQAEQRRRRYVQWPYAWADEQMKVRDR